MYFDYIKDFYEEDLYDNSDIAEFTEWDWLTPEQYQDITGEEYAIS